MFYWKYRKQAEFFRTRKVTCNPKVEEEPENVDEDDLSIFNYTDIPLKYLYP